MSTAKTATTAVKKLSVGLEEGSDRPKKKRGSNDIIEVILCKDTIIIRKLMLQTGYIYKVGIAQK